MPNDPEPIVINTGPLVTLGRAGALDLVGQLSLRFLTPPEVEREIDAGAKLGHPVTVPAWVTVVPLRAPLSAVATESLDAGEAAVIQLALERRIGFVCIDEWRGRRAAAAVGLGVTGSLGLLGRAKTTGLISELGSWIDRLTEAGAYLHPKLVATFLAAFGE